MSETDFQPGNPSTDPATAPSAAVKPEKGIRSEASVVVMAPVDVVYRFYRDVRNMPLFTPQLESVEVRSPKRSHWTWRALKNRVRVEWDAEITEEIPGSMLAWKTVGESEVEHRGRVWFSELPAARGTMVRVQIEYDPPGGKITDALEAMFGENPLWNLRSDLKKMRSLIECGEIPSIEGQPRGGQDEDVDPRLH